MQEQTPVEAVRAYAGRGRLGVAVSGGGDSVALAVAAAEGGLQPVLLHMNYGLRGAESEADEEAVRELGRRLGCEVRVRRVRPESRDEDCLRRLRYGWLREQPEEIILTGHTLEDQAETILFRIARGSGPAGLAGILPELEGRFARPFLGLRRQALRQWLRERGHCWREDESNEDRLYRRNWIRHELLPRLRENLNPEIDRRLAALARVTREEEEWLRPLVENLLEGMVERGGHGWVLDCVAWRAQPPGCRRRLLRALIEREKGNLTEIEFGHIEAILHLCEQREGEGRLQTPGLDVMRSFDKIRVVRRETLDALPVRNYRVALAVPGRTEIPEQAGWLEATIEEACHYNEDGGGLDWDRLTVASEDGQHLSLRNWRPGDSLIQRDKEDAVKVKELFQKNRIPLWRRRSWPMLVLGDEPVWAGDFGPDREYAAGPDTRRELRLQWIPAAGS
ncbi:MAG: tRNA lysidine(34) synthetase TilS [Bryobacter sp.]|jgi:tRNA(Ile)-lysidine synthase|nr:tRNA lysidine(34) synthetase TilS [Bryobacter sp. CoA8 C33]